MKLPFSFASIPAWFSRKGPVFLLVASGSFIALVAVLIFSHAHAARPARIAKGVYQSEGYVGRIQRLIDSGALKFNPKSHQLYTENLLPQDLAWIKEASTPNWGFERDLAASNQALEDYDPKQPALNPGVLIWIAFNQPVVDERFAEITLPSRYVAAQRKALAGKKPSSKGGAYQFSGPDLSLLLVSPEEAGEQQIVALWGDAADHLPAPASKFLLKMPPPSPAYSALLQWKKEDQQVHLEVRADPKLKLRVNGQPASEDAILHPGSLIAITYGDWAGSYVFTEVPGRGLSESGSITLGGTVGAEGNPLQPFRGLTSTPDRYYQTLQQRCSECQTDHPAATAFDPTIKSTLQYAVQGALEREMEELNGRAGNLGGRDNRGEPASVLLMDALTGDIITMASWPSPATPLPAGYKNTKSFRRHQDENGNFRRHVIGSVGKAFWTAATWDCFPGLSDLEVGPKATTALDRVTTTLGIIFEKPAYPQKYPSGLRGKPMNRQWFFAHSTNTWFVDMMLLSLAIRGAGEKAEIYLGGAPVAALPDAVRHNVQSDRLAGQSLSRLPVLNKNYVTGQTVTNFEDFPTTQKLATAFDLAVSGRPKEKMDLSVIQEIIKLTSEQDRRQRLLRFDLAPDAPHLDFDPVKSLYPDLISHLLGGGTAWWTNVKLAEAMGRLGTERRISARLVRAAGQPSPPAPEWTDLSAETRKLMRECLQGATNTGAQDYGKTTAAPLQDVLDKWNGGSSRAMVKAIRRDSFIFRCYSKTGTAYLGKWDADFKVDSGNYVFCLSLENAEGKPVKAVSGAIYIQRRGSSMASAVPIAKSIFPLIKQFYFDAP